MGCEEIKRLIPAYIKHTAASQEIKDVEEHLCVCDNCRQYLATVMDKEEEFKEKIEHPESAPNNKDIQIVSEKEISPQDIPLNSQEEQAQEQKQEEKKEEEKITEEKEPPKPEIKKEEPPAAEVPPAEKVTEKVIKEPSKPKEEEKKSSFFEYLVLIIGIAVLVFLVRLLMKG